jgi:hypothetical protein
MCAHKRPIESVYSIFVMPMGKRKQTRIEELPGPPQKIDIHIVT